MREDNKKPKEEAQMGANLNKGMPDTSYMPYMPQTTQMPQTVQMPDMNMMPQMAQMPQMCCPILVMMQCPMMNAMNPMPYPTATSPASLNPYPNNMMGMPY